MKNIIVSIALLLLTVGADAQFVKADLQVSGLTCSMCSRATEKSLRTLAFIENIVTDLNTSTFVLSFKPNASVDFEQIKQKVKDAGFSVAMLKPYYRFENLTVVSSTTFKYGNATFQFVDVPDKHLNGVTPIRIIDKGFLQEKEFKKYAKLIPELGSDKHLYHVTF